MLCYDCHKEKTAKAYPEPEHGTLTMYKKYKCRCDECRQANALYERNRRSGWVTDHHPGNA